MSRAARSAASAASAGPAGSVPDIDHPADVVHPAGGARLDVRGLRKVYGGIAKGGSGGAGSRGGASVEAVADLTFEVRPGELVCVVGPSGAGSIRSLPMRSHGKSSLPSGERVRSPD